MDPQLFIHILLFSCLVTTAAAASEATMAKPNCLATCGNVSIPFPFGIGKGCFMNEWFEVVCTKTNNSFLKRINLEVTQISYDARTLEAKFPIIFWNCSDRKTPKNYKVSLDGSPFMFSEQDNKFAVVGCGTLAVISSEVDGRRRNVGACASACRTNDDARVNESSSCDGIDCCQTSIPSNLQDFNATFLDIGLEISEIKAACRCAFLVNETWFSESVKNLSAFHDMTDVPVVLYWRLYLSLDGVDSLRKSAVPYDENRYNPIQNRSDFCYTYNDTSSSRVNLLVCDCKNGFKGNAYLQNGCQDFDECNDPENPNICGDRYEDYDCVNTYGHYSCVPKVKSHNNVLLIGISSGFGAVSLLLGSWGLFKLVKKRRKIQRKKKFFKRNGGLLLEQQLFSDEANVERTKLFNSKELERATDRFNRDRVLGEGGQGTVYKGMLTDGKIVAIKKSQRDNEEKMKEFINEIVILSQINHRNVVKLLGCCLETEVPLLVYEFVPNGTLFQYIYDEQEEFPLTWEIRLRIATEVAGALSYLHTSASLPIYHRDIKSSNILLDGKYRAKVADFGISRSIAVDQTHLITVVRGTEGYLDPEYFQSCQFTDKSDVYSFGVVLIELLTGQKPISNQRPEQDISLVTYFMQSMDENNLFDIVDARVMKEGKREAIVAFAELAKRCLNLNGRNRPIMKEVAALLEDIRNSEKAYGAHEPDVKEVECVREVADQPWEIFSTSTRPADFGDPASSSSVELSLFGNIAQ